LSAEQEKFIRKQWKKFVERSTKEHPTSSLTPYPGKLFRLLDFKTEGPRFTKKFGNVSAIPVSVGAVVSTSDDQIVIGEGRLGTEMIGSVAGYMEKEDPDYPIS